MLIENDLGHVVIGVGIVGISVGLAILESNPDNNVVHILNAVSPGWTIALPFTRWVVENQPLLR